MTFDQDICLAECRLHSLSRLLEAQGHRSRLQQENIFGCVHITKLKLLVHSESREGSTKVARNTFIIFPAKAWKIM